MFNFLILFITIYSAMLSAQAQQLTVNGTDEILFEGRPLQVTCATTLNLVSWWKNEIKIAEVNNGVIRVNSSVQSMIFVRTEESFTMGFESLRVTDSGTYTCTASDESVTISGTVEILVYHNDQCITTWDGRLEYLVEEGLRFVFINCTYPAIENTTSTWLSTSSMNTIPSFPLKTTNYTNILKGGYPFFLSDNGTTLNCFVNKSDGVVEPGQSTFPFSCSVGPLYFYERPFVRINSSNDGIVGWKEQLKLCCRLVPLTTDAEFRWDVPPQVGMLEFAVSEGMSCLTMTNFEVAESGLTDIVVTCRGKVSNTSYTDEYTFSVLQEATTEASDKGTESSEADGQSNGGTTASEAGEKVTGQTDGGIDTSVLVIIVISAIVVILIAVLVQPAIWCIIRKYDRKRNPNSDITSSQNQNVNDNAGLDDNSTYNEILRQQPSTSPPERSVGISDEDINSSNEILEERGKVNLRHQSPSHATAISGVGFYSSVNRSPPVFDQADSLYHDLPSFDIPIDTHAHKQKKGRRSSSHSNNEPSSGQDSTQQVDDESGISISNTTTEDNYFELSDFADAGSTA